MVEPQLNQALSLLHEYGFHLSNREWAALTWIGVLIGVGLCIPGVRKAPTRILQTAFAPKLLGIWLVYLAWITGFALLSNSFSFWQNALTKDTCVWTLTAGVVLISKFPDASGRRFFKDITKRVASVTVILEYFIALSTFSFWTEIFLQLIIGFFAVRLVYSELEGSADSLRTVNSGILAVIGVFLIGHTIRELYLSAEPIDLHLHALRVVWPILLTFWVLLLVYGLAVTSSYKVAFRRMSLSQNEGTATWKARLGMMLALGIRLRWIHEAGRGGTALVARARSLRHAFRAARGFAGQKLAEERREALYDENLIRFAGSAATDEEGRPLDKREFRETVQALFWLYTCQIRLVFAIASRVQARFA